MNEIPDEKKMFRTIPSKIKEFAFILFFKTMNKKSVMPIPPKRLEKTGDKLIINPKEAKKLAPALIPNVYSDVKGLRVRF